MFFGMQEALRVPEESKHGDAVMEAIVKARNGSVLGKGSILKMYFFPGQKTSSHVQIDGASHVYKVQMNIIICKYTKCDGKVRKVHLSLKAVSSLRQGVSLKAE